MVCALQLLKSLPPALPRLQCPNVPVVCVPCTLRPAMHDCSECGCPCSGDELQVAVISNRQRLHLEIIMSQCR